MDVRTPAARRPPAEDVAALVGRLTGAYGERAVTSRAIREQHGHGEGLADAALPDVVVFPETNEEVAAIVRLCRAARVPVIHFGVGTSLAQFGQVAEALSAGHVEPRLMVTDTVSMEQLPASFEALKQPSHHCKVMLDPWAQ